jgi:hypothetical protein
MRLSALTFTCLSAVLGCGSKDYAESAAAASAAASSTSGVESAPLTAAASIAAEVPPAAAGSAPVALDGAVKVPTAPDASEPRLAVTGMTVPVYSRPDSGSKTIGFLRAGAVIVADQKNVSGAGCSGGFRGIKPAGFVCLADGLSEDLQHPVVVAVGRPPDVTQKLPYMYGTVTRGGPVYDRIPSQADLDRFEPNLDKHMQKWKKDEVSGAGYGHELWFKWSTPPSFGAWDAWEEKRSEPLPAWLAEHAELPRPLGLGPHKQDIKIGQVDRKQGMSFVSSYLVEGRRYNVTPDLRVMPADRFRPIRGSDFHGVRIGVDVEFPFALIRKKGAKKFTWSASKNAMVAAEDIEYRAFVGLTGKQKLVKNVLHYETKDGLWVDDRHASRLDPAKRMPKWGKNGEKWLDINITKQTLVAFEGETAVFATLVSTGEDGLFEGNRATKKGIYRIHTKHLTNTMDSDAVGEEFELRDVPYVQYFEEGYALHAAYWHDSFGTPKSHGCINLSPEDARRIFFWTEPQVPTGWHSALRPLTGTILFIHP